MKQTVMKQLKRFTFLFLFSCVATLSQGADSDLEIAYAGPLSGSAEKTGTTMVNAIEMLFEEINEQGGIEGRKLVLNQFDDENKPETGVRNAHTLAEGNNLAVIGHNRSTVSFAAGKVYEARGIPAISPVSTSSEVTKANGWYFRTINNDKFPARFSAVYVQQVFKEDTVTVIQDDESYGSFLGSEFLKNAERLGLNVAYQHEYDLDHPQLLQNLDRIVEELLRLPEIGVIFLATHSFEAAQLVTRIRKAGIENNILGGDTLTGENFIRHLKEIDPKRIWLNTNRVYSAAPFIFDAANQAAQSFRTKYQQKFGIDPGWQAAFAYDTAKVIVEAIRVSEIAKHNNGDITRARRQLRETIASFNSPLKGVPGLTGLNYFDELGDPTKPVAIGFYQGPYFVAALTQFQLIDHPEGVLRLEEKIKNSQIIQVGDLYFFETNVVYAGVKLNKIRQIDFNKTTFHADFSLWLRSHEKLDYKNILFQDVIEPVKMELIREENLGLNHYQLVRVQGVFQGDTNNPDRLGRFSLSIRFRHSQLPRNRALFIPDSLGMGTIRPQVLLQQIQESQVLDPNQSWIVDTISSHSSSTSESALGSLLTNDDIIEYSVFNLDFRLSKAGLDLIFANVWYLFGFYLAINLLVSLLGIYLLLRLFQFLARKTKTDFDDQLLVIIRVPLHFLVFFVGLTFIQKDLGQWLSDGNNQLIEKILELLIVVIVLMGFFYRSGNLLRESFIQWAKSTETKLDDLIAPHLGKIVKTLSVILVGMKAGEIFFGLSAVSFVGILGAFGLAIGLLFKDFLSEVVACFNIYWDNPFQEGDKVSIGGGDAGVLVRVGLRSTVIRPDSGQLVQIPNTAVVGSRIENYSRAVEAKTSYQLKINGITSSLLKTIIGDIRGILEQAEGVMPYEHTASFLGFEGNGRVIQITFVSVANPDEIERILDRMNMQILQLLESHEIAQIDYEFLHIEQSVTKRSEVQSGFWNAKTMESAP